MMRDGHRTRSKAVSSSLAALAFIIVLITGLVVAGLMLTKWRIAEQHYEERGKTIVSMAREVVKMRIRYLAEDAGNQTIIRPLIYLKSAWMGESRLTHILVIGRDGSIIVDADVDIRVSPMETLRLKPSDLHPSLAKYDSDYEAFQSEVKLIVLHTGLGNIVSAAPPMGEYRIITLTEVSTQNVTLHLTMTNTTTVQGGKTYLVKKITVTKKGCNTEVRTICECTSWTTVVTSKPREVWAKIQDERDKTGFYGICECGRKGCYTCCDYCEIRCEETYEKGKPPIVVGASPDEDCEGHCYKGFVTYTTSVCVGGSGECSTITRTKCSTWLEVHTSTYEPRWAGACPLTFISLGAAGISAMAPILLLMRRAGRRAGVRETWPKPR